jgi:hypothetical protein
MSTEEDDFEDVEWEEEDIDETPTLSALRADIASSPSDKVIQITMDENDIRPKKKVKKAPSRYYEVDYATALTRRQESFTVLLHKLKTVVEWSNDQEFLGTLLSTLPSDLLPSSSAASPGKPEKPSSRKRKSKKAIPPQPPETVSDDFPLSYIFSLDSWLEKNFKLKSSSSSQSSDINLSNVKEMLEEVIPERSVNSFQYVQLWYGILTALNIRCRLVCVMNPLPLSPHVYEDLGDDETIRMKSLAKKKTPSLFTHTSSISYYWLELLAVPTEPAKGKNDTSLYFKDEDEQETKKGEEEDLPESSFRVVSKNTSFIKNEGMRWIHYDCLLNVFNEPKSIEEQVLKNKELKLAIACECVRGTEFGGTVSKVFTDVTSKYSFVQTKPISLTLRSFYTFFKGWIDVILQEVGINQNNQRNGSKGSPYSCSTSSSQIVDLTFDSEPKSSISSKFSSRASTISPYHHSLTSSSSSSSSRFSSYNEILLHEQREEKAVLRSEEQEKLTAFPTSIAAFQNHPIYCLERHLKVCEILDPERKKVVGTIRNEDIYLQEHKLILKSKVEWKRERKQIIDGEIPLKVKTRTISVPDHATGGKKKIEKEKEFYAIFQTERYQVLTSFLAFLLLFYLLFLLLFIFRFLR